MNGSTTIIINIIKSKVKKVQELAKYLLENILAKEDILELKSEESAQIITLKIEVKPESIGRLIGKQGKIINSLRNLLKIVAYKETGKKLIIEIVKE